MVNNLLNDIHQYLPGSFLIERRHDIHRLGGVIEPIDVLLHVDDALLLQVQHIEYSVSPRCCPVVHRKQHELLVRDDLPEVGIVKSEVAMLSLRVRRCEVAEDFDLIGYSYHRYAPGVA